MSKIFFCVSAFEGNLDLLKYADDYVVYVKEGGALSGLPEIYETVPNYGYNIYSYLNFIVENYDRLPDRIYFLKNNIYPRHLTEQEFVSQLQGGEDHFFSRNSISGDLSSFLKDGYFFEINNSWYLRENRPKYFGSAKKFYEHFFSRSLDEDYLRFCPGGNVMKTREQIKSRPVEFYKALMRAVDYKVNAPESFLLERFLDHIFCPSKRISNHYADPFLVVTTSALRWSILANLAKIRDHFIKFVDRIARKVFNRSGNYGS